MSDPMEALVRRALGGRLPERRHALFAVAAMAPLPLGVLILGLWLQFG